MCKVYLVIGSTLGFTVVLVATRRLYLKQFYDLKILNFLREVFKLVVNILKFLHLRSSKLLMLHVLLVNVCNQKYASCPLFY